jgi:hypothetical protein
MSLNAEWHIRLRQVLVNYFDENELETLCYDLGIDYQDLPGDGKTKKTIELVKHFARRGKTAELIDYCSRQRPNLEWDKIRAAAAAGPLAFESEPDSTERTAQHPEKASAFKSARPFILAAAVILAIIALYATWQMRRETGNTKPSTSENVALRQACIEASDIVNRMSTYSNWEESAQDRQKFWLLYGSKLILAGESPEIKKAMQEYAGVLGEVDAGRAKPAALLAPAINVTYACKPFVNP